MPRLKLHIEDIYPDMFFVTLVSEGKGDDFLATVYRNDTPLKEVFTDYLLALEENVE